MKPLELDFDEDDIYFSDSEDQMYLDAAEITESNPFICIDLNVPPKTIWIEGPPG